MDFDDELPARFFRLGDEGGVAGKQLPQRCERLVHVGRILDHLGMVFVRVFFDQRVDDFLPIWIFVRPFRNDDGIVAGRSGIGTGQWQSEQYGEDGEKAADRDVHEGVLGFYDLRPMIHHRCGNL